jgi:tripartite-type tricarboxylate transporter receptor subunit TctC
MPDSRRLVLGGFVCAGGHIIKRLSAEVSSALKNPAVMERITELGAIAAGGTPAKLAQFQRAEQEKWGKVIQAAKIKAD